MSLSRLRIASAAALAFALLGASTARAAGTTAPPKAEEKKEAELYLSLTGGPMFGFGSTHQWASVCPSAPAIGFAPGCTTTSPVGFIADLRLGMNFNGLALELFGLGAGDWTSATLESNGAASARMDVGRVGGGGGGGIRFLGKKSFTRFQIGGGGGVLVRHVYTTMSSLDGSSVDYVAPMVRADLGFILAGFLSVGVLGYVEFTGEVNVAPNFDALGPGADQLEAAIGPTTVFEGPQYFLGPVVGFQFGG